MRAGWWMGLAMAGYCSLTAQAGVLGTAAPVRAQAESIAKTSNPRSLYVLHCAGCHGMDGAGSALGQVPDMRQLGQFLQRPGGRQFLIQVPGVMGSGLNDEEVAQVTNWVFKTLVTDVKLQSFVPYSAAEVGQVRALPAIDVFATRARLLGTGPRSGATSP
jgi:mono/diheme cytochrome c family protein